MTGASFDRNILGFEAAKLLETLLKRAGSDGRAQVSAADLRADSGLSPGALTRARTKLVERGLVRVEPSFSANGLRGANIYILDLTALRPTSSEVSEGESGQKRTEGVRAPSRPGDSEVRAAPVGKSRYWKDLLTRLLRRSRSS